MKLCDHFTLSQDKADYGSIFSVNVSKLKSLIKSTTTISNAAVAIELNAMAKVSFVLYKTLNMEPLIRMI